MFSHSVTYNCKPKAVQPHQNCYQSAFKRRTWQCCKSSHFSTNKHAFNEVKMLSNMATAWKVFLSIAKCFYFKSHELWVPFAYVHVRVDHVAISVGLSQAGPVTDGRGVECWHLAQATCALLCSLFDPHTLDFLANALIEVLARNWEVKRQCFYLYSLLMIFHVCMRCGCWDIGPRGTGV